MRNLLQLLLILPLAAAAGCGGDETPKIGPKNAPPPATNLPQGEVKDPEAKTKKNVDR